MSTDRTIGIFDREIRKLFDLSLRILEEKSNTSIKSGSHTTANRYLQRYIAIYGATKTQQHTLYFLNFFERNRVNILNILNDDKWLIEGNHVIQYGEELKDPELAKRAQKRRISISVIYSSACQLRDRVDKSLKGLPDQGFHKELLYPDYILLHLYRILREVVTDVIDRSELSRIIGVLESELGDGNDIPKNSFDGLAGIAKNLIESLNISQNIQLPSEKELTGTLESVFGNNDFTKTITSQFSDVLTSKSIGEGLTKAFTKFQDPSFMNQINELVTKTIPPETLGVLTKSVEGLNDPNALDIGSIINSITQNTKLLNLGELGLETGLQNNLLQNFQNMIEGPSDRMIEPKCEEVCSEPPQ